jgi:hypothetical protein
MKIKRAIAPEEKYISKLVRFSLIKLRVYKDEIKNNIDPPRILFLYLSPRTVIFKRSNPINILPIPS